MPLATCLTYRTLCTVLSAREARTLITPQLSQTYAQVAKSSTANSATQTDENITRIKCPPLQLLQPLLSVPQPNKYPSITSVSTSSSTTQANPLPSASSIKPTTKIASRLPKPISSAAAPDNSLNTSASSLSAETRTLIKSNKSAAAGFQLKFNPYQNLTLLHPMVNILMHLKSHSLQNEIQEIEESARKFILKAFQSVETALGFGGASASLKLKFKKTGLYGLRKDRRERERDRINCKGGFVKGILETGCVGQVCPDVDKELWCLGSDRSGDEEIPERKEKRRGYPEREKKSDPKGEVGGKELGKDEGWSVLGTGEENPRVGCSVILTRNPKRE
ncbi:hypothetical protein TNCV_794931 [Trichonephila clavipes]|nr:hypothetical protein TNCV_794931 [Trichonephila clavipes]